MTRSFALWLILGLALTGCPRDETDTGPSDTDTDVDSDTDTDSDTDADFATIVAKTSVVTKISLYQDFEPLACDEVTECRIPVGAAGTYDVYAKNVDYMFGAKSVEVSANGDYDAEWTDGQWGAYLTGTWVETEDSDYPSVEHEIDVLPDGEFVTFGITRAAECGLDTKMTGLSFSYGPDEDGYWCVGSANTDMTEVTLDHGDASVSVHRHLVRAD
ncbi:MAG: hypothetical protein WC702_03005 [Patescibacteria group bacterium]|jgi:hypothetical protein